jgi:hypothetical protein
MSSLPNNTVFPVKSNIKNKKLLQNHDSFVMRNSRREKVALQAELKK